MVAAVDSTTQKVLDAARTVFATAGLRRSTMEDVARKAGLGRATVYRKFATKDALVETVLLTELREYLQVLDDVADPTVGFDEQVVEGFVATLRYVREHSLLASVIERDGEWGMTYFTTMAGPVIAAAREYLAAKIRIAQREGAATGADADLVAEVLVRLCHSLVLTPDGAIPSHDDDAARAFARTVLVPLVAVR